ncbi:Ig-specific serine endopeptidase MIP [Mycoplasma putrefaciens]|uniref:DUF31 domain-containing protein n=1 Tax=Mycoplasma putrefaciens Mput9231 TaxID=1292033 RepID=M9WCF3_9MOLU|nr:lipoprotein [Mycoplasma putrefaciens]AGJ90822.1 Hypothetical protein, predicted lipoprotein [Mycoplasma putrefaciens Mput9231]
MKLLNKLLVMSSVYSIVFPSLLVVACNKIENSSSSLSIEQIDTFINNIKTEEDLKSVAEFNFETTFGRKKKLSDTLPTEIEESPSSLKITLKDKKYKDNISISVENARTDKATTFNRSNINGTVTLFVTFLNRKNNKAQTRELILSGLSKNGGFDHNGRQDVDPISAFGGHEGVEKYVKSDQKERFKYDNNNYIRTLESMYNPNVSSQKVDIEERFGLKISDDEKNKFDQLAEKVGFDSYYNAALKGFTLPVNENTGKDTAKKLKVNDRPEVNKGPSYTDALGATDYFKTNGLARTLINETYKTMAVQTFQVKFTYKKDFADEISLLKNHISLIKSWGQSELKDFKEDQINKLEYEYKLQIEKIRKEIATLIIEDKGIRAAKEKEIQSKELKLKNEREKILSHTNETLIQLQNEEIKKLETRRDKGEEVGSESGTMWIMDYQLNSDQPTVFYFGTNSHVAKAITNNLTAVSITRIKETVKVGEKLMLNSFDPNFETFTFSINSSNKSSISAIFHATDFIDKNPSDYLTKKQADKYKEAGFYADFAVIEFDFEKLLLSNTNFSVSSAGKQVNEYMSHNAKKIADIITNSYATRGKYIKFKSDSYLTDYKKIDRPIIIDSNSRLKDLENIYILGYPTSESDYYLNQHEDAKQVKDKKNDFSLWINADSKYYGTTSTSEGFEGNYTQDELSRGNFLSYQIGYRSFIDKPGLTDAFLAAHRVGNDLYTLTQNGKTRQYFNFGLELMPRFYAPSGGASGSSVRNKNNELIAVYHAANGSARTGLATMFRSPGYNYEGLFGDYNLPQYDLIYGTGKNQKRSYRHALEKKYDSKGIKTKLFESGFSKEKVPENFKFKD